MKRKKIEFRYEPDTRFELVPLLTAPRRGGPEIELDRLTRRLLDPHLARAESVLHQSILRSAANEAASLAWSTPFPLLVLPELLKERLEVLRRRVSFQADLQRRCRPSDAEAA